MKGGNGVEMGEENDMLRLDSMMLIVQLNLRQLMEVSFGWLGFCKPYRFPCDV